jgi:hypothetical protein
MKVKERLVVRKDTLSKFKSELKKIDGTENHAVPKHYFYGSRKLNIILTQLISSCRYIGQSKKKCFKFSRAAPHRQDG